VEKGYGDAHVFIKQYKEGVLQLQPGCDMEQTLETQVTGVLNNIREQAGKVCTSSRPPSKSKRYVCNQVLFRTPLLSPSNICKLYTVNHKSFVANTNRHFTMSINDGGLSCKQTSNSVTLVLIGRFD
jgi:hypothetical protein